MKRCALFLLLLATASSAGAQIGKRVLIPANSPEDKALSAITAETDQQKRVAMFEEFVQKFAGSEAILVALEMLQVDYMKARDYPKVLETGESALALDPLDFMVVANMVRAAEQMNDAQKIFALAERAGEMVKKFKSTPPPAGMSKEDWASRQQSDLSAIAEDQNYVAYTFYSRAVSEPNLAQRIALLERFAAAFPDSPYTGYAYEAAAATAQQANDPSKLAELAQKALSLNPDSISMLILTADSGSESGEKLEEAENNARRALALLPKAERPANVPEESWKQQISVQEGLTHSILGQLLIRQQKMMDAIAELKLASPLLKSEVVSYARNQYRLGFALGKLKRLAEARNVLNEVAALNTPYKGLIADLLRQVGGTPARPR